jgi:hypothetical protein
MEDIIPECPDGSDEIIYQRDPTTYARECFKKCREGGTKIGTICYYCDEGYTFLMKKKKCQNINNGRIINAIREAAEIVKESHCMKNTTLVGTRCELDCSVLGLQPFDNFCATNEEVYKKHLAEFDKSMVGLIPKWLINKLENMIFNPPEIDYDQFHVMKDEYLEYLKTDKIYTNRYHIMATLKSRIKVMGRDLFTRRSIDWALENAGEYREYVQTVCPKVASYLYDNSIKEYTEDINLKETFFYYANLAFEFFGSFFYVDKIKAVYDNCFADINNLNIIDCMEKVYDIIGIFDPTFMTSIFTTTLKYYKEECKIDYSPEKSKEIIYGFNYLLEIAKTSEYN